MALQETIPNFSMIVPLEAAFLGRNTCFFPLISLNSQFPVKIVGVELIKAYQGIIYFTHTEILYNYNRFDYTLYCYLILDIIYIYIYAYVNIYTFNQWSSLDGFHAGTGFAKILIDPTPL